jgi:hypothetical protein
MVRLLIVAALLLDVGFGARCGPTEPDCDGPDCPPQTRLVPGPEELALPDLLPECTQERLSDEGGPEPIAATEAEDRWRIVVVDLDGQACTLPE